MEEITEQTPEPWASEVKPSETLPLRFSDAAPKLSVCKEQIHPGFNEILSCRAAEGVKWCDAGCPSIVTPIRKKLPPVVPAEGLVDVFRAALTRQSPTSMGAAA